MYAQNYVTYVTYAFYYSNLVGQAEVLDSVIPLQPKGLGVLVEADLDNVEMFGKLGNHSYRIALNDVQAAAELPELLVQVIQALQEEGHLVVLAIPASVILYGIFWAQGLCSAEVEVCLTRIPHNLQYLTVGDLIHLDLTL